MKRCSLFVQPALCGLLLAACACTGPHGGTVNDAGQPPVEVLPQTYVFECDRGHRFTARIEEKEAWLFLPGFHAR